MNVGELLDDPVTSKVAEKKFGFKETPAPPVVSTSPFKWGDIITYKEKYPNPTIVKFLVVGADVEKNSRSILFKFRKVS